MRRIAGPKAAAALADPLRRRIVLSCVPSEHSVAELATAMAVDIKRLHYHVTALVRLRLLVIARTRRRAGRPIKLYRATASSFFVPADIAGELPSAQLMRQMQQSLAAARRAQDEGILYDMNENGQPRMRMVASSATRIVAATETWRVLALSREDGRRLSGEVGQLLEKYGDRSGDACLIHFALCSAKLHGKR